MKSILTLDAGTTSVKVCLFSEGLEQLGFSSIEYSLLTPCENVVELEAEAYWQACRQGIWQALQQAGAGCGDVCAVAVTTQGETLVPVDTEGAPLRNAIMWLDARAQDEAADIGAQLDAQEIYRTTGMSQIGAACPVAKVLWIKRKEPQVFARTHKFLLLLDYLLFRLTGRLVTDRCLLSSTGYYDICGQRYWSDMLSCISVEETMFPTAVDTGSVAGQVTDAVADDLGIARGTAVIPCGMDQAASAVGAGNIAEGVVTETTGTCLVLAATAEYPDFRNAAKVNIIRHAVPGKFLVLPYNPTAGIVLKWFKDEFCQEETRQSLAEGRSVYDVLGELAAAVPPLSCGLTVLPHFAGMLSPEVDSSARGVFAGVALGMGKAYFVRAIMESVAFMLRENIELLEGMGIPVSEMRSLGGGARSALWSQIKADACVKPILTMEQEESTSLGAAILAAVALGFYANAADACSSVSVSRRYEPGAPGTEIYKEGYARYRELYRRLKGLEKG